MTDRTLLSDAEPDYQFEPTSGGWYAYDANIYDGAPDSSARARAVGYGKTKAEALAHYIEELNCLDESPIGEGHSMEKPR